jgi:protein-disulfide isomerase
MTTGQGLSTMRRCGAGFAIALAMAPAVHAQPAASPEAALAARIGTAVVTLEEVDRAALDKLIGSYGNVKLSQALYEARRSALEDVLADRLLSLEAARRAISTPALVAAEIDAKVSAPSDDDAGRWYDGNVARLQGVPLSDARDSIKALLMEERKEAVRAQLLSMLRQKESVRILLEPPREKVAGDGPFQGPADAPIHLVEFSDFQCSFCTRVEPTLRALRSIYGDRLRLTYRHFPLGSHPNANAAAEAAMCANDQGHFWSYHERLFADQRKLSPQDLKKHARDLGLDGAAFERCFDSHAHRAHVQLDVAAGVAIGVSGTPAFFINGRPLHGAQPLDAFKRVIDDELARNLAR